MMIGKYIEGIRDVLNLVIIAIAMVERPGEGAEKKKEAIRIVQELARDYLPDWVIKLLLNETTLGILIDYLVSRFNKEQIFVHY